MDGSNSINPYNPTNSLDNFPIAENKSNLLTRRIETESLKIIKRESSELQGLKSFTKLEMMVPTTVQQFNDLKTRTLFRLGPAGPQEILNPLAKAIHNDADLEKILNEFGNLTKEGPLVFQDRTGQKAAVIISDNPDILKNNPDLRKSLADLASTPEERAQLLNADNYVVLSLSDFRYLIRQYISWYNQQIPKKIDPKIDETNTKDENIPVLSELKTVREEMKEFFRLFHKQQDKKFEPLVRELESYDKFIQDVVHLFTVEPEITWTDCVIMKTKQLVKEKKMRLNFETLKKEEASKEVNEKTVNRLFERASYLIHALKPFTTRHLAPDYKP